MNSENTGYKQVIVTSGNTNSSSNKINANTVNGDNGGGGGGATNSGGGQASSRFPTVGLKSLLQNSDLLELLLKPLGNSPGGAESNAASGAEAGGYGDMMNNKTSPGVSDQHGSATTSSSVMMPSSGGQTSNVNNCTNLSGGVTSSNNNNNNPCDDSLFAQFSLVDFDFGDESKCNFDLDLTEDEMLQCKS